MERVYTIRTPEMVRFDFRLAGLGSRFLAWAVDVAVIAALLLAVVAVGALLTALLGFAVGPELGLALTLVAVFLVLHGYFMFFEWRWSGRTPGKKFMRLRVLQDNGTRIAGFQAVGRNLLRLFDSLFPFYAIGAAVAAASTRGQRLGDLVAGTIVVCEDREAGLPQVKALADERQNAFLGDARLARLFARRLSKRERELLIDAARRADEIALAVRGPLFERLAKHFADRLEVKREAHLSDEKLIQNLARALLAAERESAAIEVRAPVGAAAS